MPVSNVARIAGAAAIAVLCAAGASWAETANEVGSPHVMTLQLPDGGVAQITYYGNFAPQVVVAPPQVVVAPRNGMAAPAGAFYAPPDPFAALDRMAAEMDAHAAMMMREAAFMATRAAQGSDGFVDVAALPAGATSTTYVASFNGTGLCARSTEIVSAGPGLRPRVISHVSGDCGGAAQAPARTYMTPRASAGARTIRVRADQPSVTNPAMLRPAVIYTQAE